MLEEDAGLALVEASAVYSLFTVRKPHSPLRINGEYTIHTLPDVGVVTGSCHSFICAGYQHESAHARRGASGKAVH